MKLKNYLKAILVIGLVIAAMELEEQIRGPLSDTPVCYRNMCN